MNLKADVLYSMPQMRQSPVFTLATMTTLALGIGATTAIFTLMHAVMLKPLPVANPSQLYRIGSTQECCYEGWEENPEQDWSLFSYVLYRRLRDAAPEFEQLAGFQAMPRQMSVRRAGTERMARPLRGEFVSGNYFFTFGVGAAAERVIGPPDDQASAAPAAVLSSHTWQQDYVSDPCRRGFRSTTTAGRQTRAPPRMARDQSAQSFDGRNSIKSAAPTHWCWRLPS